MENTEPKLSAEEFGVKVRPPGPASRSALDELETLVGRGNYMGLYGIFIERGAGNYVFDLDGNTYLDCLSGAAANNLGYNFPQIAASYAKIASRIPHTSFSYSPTLYPQQLARKLIKITPGTFPKKVLFGLCGSKSNEDAFEIVWRVTGRQTILRFSGTYLGATWLTKLASGFGSGQKHPLSKQLFCEIPFPCRPADSACVLQQIATLLEGGGVAAAVIEPILADGGALVPPVGFYSDLQKLLKKHQALLIADESQTGMGRTGYWWGVEHEGIVPDLLVVGKALAAGYAPISALVGRAELVDSLAQGIQIGTFIGHPPSVAAALAVIDCIETHGLIKNIARQGSRLLSGLQQLVGSYPQLLVSARGRGGLIGVEVCCEQDPMLARLIGMRCLERGLYLGYYGAYQQVLRIAPPLTLTSAEVEQILQTLEASLHDYLTGKISAQTRENVQQFCIGLPMPEPSSHSYCLT